MIQISEGCRVLLRKLHNQKVIGGRHLPEAICLKHIKTLPKAEHKAAINDWKWCIAEGLVLTKPKPDGRHVSLNPRRSEEIRLLIE